MKAHLCSPQENNLKVPTLTPRPYVTRIYVLQLHATLINTKLRNTTDKTRQAFDAAPVLQAFGEVDLGTHRLGSVQLSQRGAFDDTNYWKSGVTIPLP